MVKFGSPSSAAKWNNVLVCPPRYSKSTVKVSFGGKPDNKREDDNGYDDHVLVTNPYLPPNKQNHRTCFTKNTNLNACILTQNLKPNPSQN